VPLVAHNSTELNPAGWSILTELLRLHHVCRHETEIKLIAEQRTGLFDVCDNQNGFAEDLSILLCLSVFLDSLKLKTTAVTAFETTSIARPVSLDHNPCRLNTSM
jgi:hypothetical protein